VINVYNNIVLTNYANQGGVSTNCFIYAALEGGLYNVTWSGNIFKGEAGSCAGSACDPGNDVVEFNTTYASAFGPNPAIYENPGFANTTDLLANRTGSPNCTGFTTTTACMGWNANTGTLTTPSVIGDLVPSASGTSGKGYQLPSLTCAPDPYYPTWLKGVVYLHWNGSSITENAGLVNKPCGL
jgi:hypothetical protein